MLEKSMGLKRGLLQFLYRWRASMRVRFILNLPGKK